MAYKTYNEQVSEHIKFLREEGLDVDQLEIETTNVVRCREIGQKGGRPAGELAYKTKTTQLDNGQCGLGTWCRGRNGVVTFKTYGLGPSGESLLVTPKKEQTQKLNLDLQKHKDAAKKARGFWHHSLQSGGATYIEQKNVGAYRIRFRNNERGRVAVIPMRDIDGVLWSYQCLNPEDKRFAVGAKAKNLFHFLKPVTDGKPFGIAESYVTAATCLELTRLPMVCVFSGDSFKSGALILRERYPNSRIILFADNDRHLERNKGVLKAEEGKKALGDNVLIAIPDFGNIKPSKSASDWNDLVRLRLILESKKQLEVLGVSKN